MAMVKRFEAYLLNLDDEVSDDPKNTRPCVVISPDEMNEHLEHVIIAPVSTYRGDFPTRIAVELLKSKRSIILDQLRAVDKARLVKKIGDIDAATQKIVIERLQELFAE
ncbi:MAG: type II toxin-antitoxin system PemK/MazF family toxin [Acidobacteriota bacterium]|nr:MAG: type II toxin-antitoxin system PemK/MazF family toxin [Acidobacteriota bacterium]